MATTQVQHGQVALVPLTVQFTTVTGAAVDADVSPTPTVKVWLVEPAGSLTLKDTLTLTKQAGATGFYGAFLDVSDRTLYPLGDYVVRWEAGVAGTLTAATDYMEVTPAPGLGDTVPLVSAYCSEAQVRAWTKPLENTDTVPSQVVADRVTVAAAYLNSRLATHYVVPFVAPYDEALVLLNIKLGAALTLENRQGERGNENKLALALKAEVEEGLADLLSGKLRMATVAYRTDMVMGDNDLLYSTEDVAPHFDVDDPNSSINRYV